MTVSAGAPRVSESDVTFRHHDRIFNWDFSPKK